MAIHPDREFVRVLPFFLQPILNAPAVEIPMPVALWKSAGNICEGSGSRCDDSEGLYYSLAGDAVTWWCPRHWYEGCLGPNAPYRLLDMTEEQYRTECREQRRRFLQDWKVVAERIESSAHVLMSRGLQTEAGKLWEAHGWIRSSINGRP